LWAIPQQLKQIRHVGDAAEPGWQRTKPPPRNRIMKQTTAFEPESNPSGRVLSKLPLLLLALAALGFAAPGPPKPMDWRGPREVDVMTVNLYIGGDISQIMALDPTDPEYLNKLVLTVTGVYADIVASDPPARMKALAKKIARRSPDLLAVQEASLLRIQSPGDLVVGGTVPATDVAFDYLELLVTELQALGADYHVASTANQIDVEMPMLTSMAPTFADVRLNDRDAILVRGDLPRGHLRVSQPQSGNFAAVIQIPGTGLEVERGWCSVDVAMRGRNFRFICTHLETEVVPQLQVLQVQELLAGPANTRLPVILAGDFNADSLGRDGSIAYPLLPAAGFVDTWAKLHPNRLTGGLTWGHDADLADPDVKFDRRIDFVFYQGKGLVPLCSNVIDVTTGLSPSPLWATDHAALTATFLFK
jgi:hypothetical protein